MDAWIHIVDLVSRLVRGITGVIIWLIGIDLLTKPP